MYNSGKICKEAAQEKLSPDALCSWWGGAVDLQFGLAKIRIREKSKWKTKADEDTPPHRRTGGKEKHRDKKV